ncbi:MAG: hypothetical protein J2P48_11430 [Alphaproteobacteria bacterium]|nr:hypothetical protein [Alphaproteobacteria bacterium]
MLMPLPGQYDKSALIAAGADINRDIVAAIYWLDRAAFFLVPKDELTIEQQEQRRAGKTTISGCGYSMGGGETLYRRYCRHLKQKSLLFCVARSAALPEEQSGRTSITVRRSRSTAIVPKAKAFP